MLLEHLKNSLNTYGEPTMYPRTYTLLEDGRHRVQWIDKKGRRAQSIYIDREPDGTSIKCCICDTPCLTAAAKYQRANGDHKKRHTCTRKCQDKLTGPTKWNPLYIERDDEGWFFDNYTGYIIRRYRPILGKPRTKEFYHRYVIEKHLGRKLLATEHVHHIDMDKTNNKLSNLWVCDHTDHLAAHHSTNDLIKPLIEAGILKFNVETGKYYLIEKGTNESSR
jgi:hypothetical protein